MFCVRTWNKILICRSGRHSFRQFPKVSAPPFPTHASLRYPSLSTSPIEIHCWTMSYFTCPGCSQYRHLAHPYKHLCSLWRIHIDAKRFVRRGRCEWLFSMACLAHCAVILRLYQDASQPTFDHSAITLVSDLRKCRYPSICNRVQTISAPVYLNSMCHDTDVTSNLTVTTTSAQK